MLHDIDTRELPRALQHLLERQRDIRSHHLIERQT